MPPLFRSRTPSALPLACIARAASSIALAANLYSISSQLRSEHAHSSQRSRSHLSTFTNFTAPRCSRDRTRRVSRSSDREFELEEGSFQRLLLCWLLCWFGCVSWCVDAPCRPLFPPLSLSRRHPFLRLLPSHPHLRPNCNPTPQRTRSDPVHTGGTPPTRTRNDAPSWYRAALPLSQQQQREAESTRTIRPLPPLRSWSPYSPLLLSLLFSVHVLCCNALRRSIASCSPALARLAQR